MTKDKNKKPASSFSKNFKKFINEKKKIDKEKIKLDLEKKKERKAEFVNSKIQIKILISEFRTFRRNQKIARKNFKKENKNLERAEYVKKLNVFNDEYYAQEEKLTYQIKKIAFDSGAKYKTFKWRMLKWVFGIKKEFNRVIWSTPKNTLKFLGIVIVIVLIFSLLFFGIDQIINIIN